MIELQDIVQEMHSASKRLEKASKNLYQLAKEKAETERVYRMELAKEIAILRSEGTPATLISDLARGKVAELKFKRDLAHDMYRSALSSLEAIQTQVSVLQTISKYQDSI